MKFLKRSAEERRQITDAVLLLRFRTTQPTSSSLSYFTYSGIAKAFRVPCSTYAAGQPLQLRRQRRHHRSQSLSRST